MDKCLEILVKFSILCNMDKKYLDPWVSQTVILGVLKNLHNIHTI